VACVDLVNRLGFKGIEILESVRLDVVAFGGDAPNVVVYAVVDVDPTKLTVGAATEVDPDQAASHCRQCF